MIKRICKDKYFLDKSSEIVSEEISELLERILHEFVFLDGLYCTDREDIVEKIKTMEEDVIWQIDEQELIKDIANYKNV